MDATKNLRERSDYREYVESILCDQNELEPHSFRMTERLLVRRGKVCGIYFCLHGPRNVKLVAIWEFERNTVLFYGSNGERVMRCRAPLAPSLAARMTRMTNREV